MLAAGFSRRFGKDKRLEPLPNSGTPGKAVGLASVEQWLAADTLDQLYVVARPDDDFAALLTKFLAHEDEKTQSSRCTLLTAVDAHLGMGHTLASAVAQIPPGALVIGLADMPWIAPETVKLLAQRLRESPPDRVLQPRYNGKSGNPLGFGPGHREALKQCSGDQGARALVSSARAAGSVLDIDVDDSGILYDIDQPDDLTGERSSPEREV